MKPQPWLLAMALAGFSLLLWQQYTPTSANPGPEKKPLLVGAGSCSAAACHNGNFSSGTTGSEYAIWITRDRHARAYETLFTERSIRMKERLGRPALPHKDQLCLHCHVYPDLDAKLEKNVPYFRTDGVSCESCHGPASNWRTEHYLPSWRSKTTEQKLAHGMRDTQSILGRTQLCVECHVGTPAKEVDHDLIAAGHPRLNFEFTAFHAHMPHHWHNSKNRDSPQDPDEFEARAWVAGQIVAASAAVQLFAARARNEKNWPEFAEMDCAACHFDLQPSRRWRKHTGTVKGEQIIPWANWYRSMTLVALRSIKAEDGALQNLTAQLKPGWSYKNTEREKIVAQADEAAKELSLLIAKLKEQRKAPVPSRQLFDGILLHETANAGPGWDEAAQIYLALATRHQMHIDRKVPVPDKLRSALQIHLFGRLNLPRNYDHPQGADPEAVRKRILKFKAGA